MGKRKKGALQVKKGDKVDLNETESSGVDKGGNVQLGEMSKGVETKPNFARLTRSQEDELQRDESKKSKWEPENWRLVLENIRRMRMENDAPVDTMGCHKCHDTDEVPEVQRYQILVALMLSSQTKDEVTYAAMQRLRVHGLNIENILATDDTVLGELIHPVGFWKSKVKYIKRTTEMLKSDFSGDIPNTIEGLCKLPGVGPKMAHICMKVAWDTVTGIGTFCHI